MVEKLYIVTPCCRPANLDAIFNSINFDIVHRWYIVYDTTRNRTYSRKYADHPKIVELECSHPGGVGHPQRNHALSIIEDGFVYFVDDDNIIHPDLWKHFPTFDRRYYYSWDQLRNKNGDDTDWVLFKNEKGKILKGDTLQFQKIDTAQVMIPKALIGNKKWNPTHYAADGLFFEDMYKQNPSAHRYIPETLCYYNALDGNL
jgi:hypothetical protein